MSFMISQGSIIHGVLLGTAVISVDTHYDSHISFSHRQASYEPDPGIPTFSDPDMSARPFDVLEQSSRAAALNRL